MGEEPDSPSDERNVGRKAGAFQGSQAQPEQICGVARIAAAERQNNHSGYHSPPSSYTIWPVMVVVADLGGR